MANFTLNGGNVPTGAIVGLFSVSEGQQVYFSKGNLQYQASTNTWKFAENQYDYVGSANSNISSSYGCYWSASYSGSSNAYRVYFHGSFPNPQNYYRYYGVSVRLARVAE